MSTKEQTGGYGICFACGRNGLIKYKTKYGRIICVHCAERPSDDIMKKIILILGN